MTVKELLQELPLENLQNIHEFFLLEYKTPREISRDSQKEDLVDVLTEVTTKEEALYCLNFFDNYDYFPVPWLKSELIDGLSDDLLVLLFSKYFDFSEHPESKEELQRLLNQSQYFLKEEARKYYLWEHYFRTRMTLEESEENPSYLSHSSASLESELQSIRDEIQISKSLSEVPILSMEEVESLSSEDMLQIQEEEPQYSNLWEKRKTEPHLTQDIDGFQTQKISFETFKNFVEKKEQEEASKKEEASNKEKLEEAKKESKQRLRAMTQTLVMEPMDMNLLLQNIEKKREQDKKAKQEEESFLAEKTVIRSYESLPKQEDAYQIPSKENNVEKNEEEKRPTPKRKKAPQLTLALDALSFMELEQDAEDLLQEPLQEIPEEAEIEESLQNDTFSTSSKTENTEPPKSEKEEVFSSFSDSHLPILTPVQVDRLTELLFGMSLLGGDYGRIQIHAIRVFFQKVMQFAPIQLRRVRNLLKNLEMESNSERAKNFTGLVEISKLLSYSTRLCFLQTALFLLGSKSLQHVENNRELIHELTVELGIHPADVSLYHLFGIGYEDVQLSAFDCLDLLGVDLDATPEQIRKAHKERIRRYHPDQFHSLGSEFQRLAERKTKELNMAVEIILHKSKN